MYKKRSLWAIDHVGGTALVKAITSERAMRILQQHKVPGPYKVKKNQDQSIVFAKILNTKVYEELR